MNALQQARDEREIAKNRARIAYENQMLLEIANAQSIDEENKLRIQMKKHLCKYYSDKKPKMKKN